MTTIRSTGTSIPGRARRSVIAFLMEGHMSSSCWKNPESHTTPCVGVAHVHANLQLCAHVHIHTHTHTHTHTHYTHTHTYTYTHTHTHPDTHPIHIRHNQDTQIQHMHTPGSSQAQIHLDAPWRPSQRNSESWQTCAQLSSRQGHPMRTRSHGKQ